MAGYRSPTSKSMYTAADSYIRLAAIQRLVRSWQDVDSLLLILGVDSQSNEATRQLMSYLLFGLAGHQLFDTSLVFSDETMEDIILLIGLDSVDLYCNPHNFPSLLPVVANWRGLQLHCLSKDQFKDGDLAEEFKIRQFIRMAHGIKKIGVPYGASTGFNPMMIEKWPLIQSYALDDFGSGGFFTMHHEVVDVADRLMLLYTTVDVPSLTHLVTQVLPSFEHQWKDLLAVVDIAGSDGIPALSEEQIAEPFNVYYTHGRTQRSVAQEECSSFPCPPHLLIGLNTCRNTLSSSSTTTTTVGSAGHIGMATHMICDCSEPRGALRCTRTYFFHSSHSSLEHTLISDSMQLQQIYMACIDAVLEGISTYSRTHNIHESEKSCVRKLRYTMSGKKLKLEKYLLESKKNIEFSLTARDYSGQSVVLQDGQYCSLIKTIRLTVYDIPSIEHSGKLCGSVSFGESFMDSVILTHSDEGDVSFSSDVIVLTSSIVRVTSWMAGGSIHGYDSEVAELLSEVKLRDTALLIANNQFVRWLDGKLYMTDNVLVFEHAQLGLVYFPLNQLKRLQLYDGGSTSAVALLIIEYDEDIGHRLPIWIREYNTLVLSIMPYTSTHRTFYKQFLPRLRSRELKGPSLEDLKGLQSEYQDIYTQLCFHQSVVAAGSSAKLMDKAQDRFSNLTRFISHLRASRSLQATSVSDNDLSALVSQPSMTTTTTSNTDSLTFPLMHCTVTVLTGVPGSGKDQLTQSVVSWDKESTKWVVLRQPFDSCEDFDIESFQSSLTTIVERMAKKLSASMRKTRVLVITPGLTDVREVVWGILAHPEKSVKETLRIGSITACVDLHNCCLDSGFLFPNLLENCAIGVVNNIVWTGQQSDDPSYIEQLIRTCNPTASFINSQPGHTLREEDMDLILSADLFSDTTCLRDRLLFHGKFLSFPHPGTKANRDFGMVCLKFHQPLDRRQLASQLTLLKSVTKDATYSTQPTVYHIRARVAFTDSVGLNELEFVRRSGHLSLSPLDDGQTKSASSSANNPDSMATLQCESCFVFFGTHLSDAWLKTWLRGCQPQTQLKKSHRTRNDLLNAEIEQIHSAHKHDPLPPGVFHNGFHYVTMDGEKTDKHPLLDQFIDDFLKAENEKIDQHNSGIVQDMFD